MPHVDLSHAPLSQTTAPPRQPGAYWFHSESAYWQILVVVRVKDGELVVWLFNEDVPVATLNGRWRGPIPPSTGPAHRHE